MSITQLVYNRLSRKGEELYLPTLSKRDIGVIGRIPLAKGFLSGKYEPGHVFEDPHRSSFNSDFNDKLLEEAMIIREKEVPTGVQMSNWSLAWCLKNSAISTVVPGSKNINQLKSNVSSLELLE